VLHDIKGFSRFQFLTTYVPIEASILLDNVFVSLVKVQRFGKMNLHFDSFGKTPAGECFEKLGQVKRLGEVNMYIKIRELNVNNV
jgi:hypothetical protein